MPSQLTRGLEDFDGRDDWLALAGSETQIQLTVLNVDFGLLDQSGQLPHFGEDIEILEQDLPLGCDGEDPSPLITFRSPPETPNTARQSRVESCRYHSHRPEWRRQSRGACLARIRIAA
jgi:hypothetical protein